MSILVHKVGINKTLGQKSNYMEGGSSLPRTDTTGWRDSLVGEWRADTGFSGAGDIWANQVSGGRPLRAYNSMVCNSSSTPHHLIFDGTNDYIWNTSTGYGGNPFTVDLSADFTIGCWARYTLGSGSSFLFCVQTGTSGGTGFLYSLLQSAQFTVTDGNQQANTSGTASNFLVSSNTWHYCSISHDRSEGKVFLYVDGKYGASFSPSYSASEGATSGGNHWNGAFNLGFGHHLRGNSSNIADSSVECAFLYVWDRYWGASQHRHMFLGQYGTGGINNSLPNFGAPRTDT